MADGDRTGDSGGFDDWLEEDAGPDTDPYAALADEDAEAEIADWMAFTQGQGEAEDGDDTAGMVSSESDEGLMSDEPDDGATTDEPANGAPTDAAPDDVETESEADAGDKPTSAAADEPEPIDVSDQEAPDQEALGQDASTPDDAEDLVETEQSPALGDTRFVDFDDEDDVTAEIPLAADEEEPLEPATSVDLSEFVGDGRADTDEIPIVAAADVVAASVVNETDETKDRGELEDPDALTHMPAVVAPIDDGDDGGDEDDNEDQDEHDTGELDALEPVADDDTGELEVVDIDDADTTDDDRGLVAAAAGAAVLAGDDGDDDDGPQLFDITREDYVGTATKEHETLAAAIAEAETEDTEQVALAAPIPGLESTVVGFDDVVEAEGHRKARARGSGNLLARVITAVVLIAALGASLVWRPALLILATVVFVIGAGEFYTALTRTGRHPIALFGFAGIVAATVGAYFSGAIAITAAFVLVLTVLLLYYAVVPGRLDPMGNLALTITVMVWVGLGSYAMLIAVSENWRPLVVGTVVLVAAMDIAQYFVGRALGRHQLAPWVSPKKTIEGLVGGVIVALGLGALLHFVEPFELTSGLALGATVAVLAPLGDLAMSAAKRSLDIKDMGSILPGHGGFLDRIDGLLFVIPAAWAIFLWAGLL